MPVALIDLVGFAAGGLVFLTFCMKTMSRLRLVAITSNVVFIAYGYGAGLYPILVLHGLLLPMNLARAWQYNQTLRRLRDVSSGPPSALPLVPFMTAQKTADGEVLFRLGAPADRLYYVSKGAVVIEEFGQRIEPGSIFGEIGLFSEHRLRTATARCAGPGEVCWIGRETILTLSRDQPEFGLALTRLIATRLAENQTALLARPAAGPGGSDGVLVHPG